MLSIISCFHLFRTWKYWHLWSAKPHAKFQFIKFVFMEKVLSLTFDQISHKKIHNIIRNEMQHANQCQLCNFHNIACSKIDRLVNEHLNSQRASITFPSISTIEIKRVYAAFHFMPLTSLQTSIWVWTEQDKMSQNIGGEQ